MKFIKQPALILLVLWSVLAYFLFSWQVSLLVAMALLSVAWLLNRQPISAIETHEQSMTETESSAPTELLGESAKIVKEQLSQIDREQMQVSSLLNDAVAVLSDSFQNLNQQATAQQNIFRRLFAGSDTHEMSLEEFVVEVEKLLNYFVDMVLQTSKDSVFLMHSLDDMTQRVNAVLGLLDEVKNIASSINLLSLNASIEAARAGDAGRGFSVVAGEIRKLSLSTDKVSDEINKLSSEVIEKLNNVTGVVHRVASSDMNEALESKEKVTHMTGFITGKNLAIQNAVAESNELSAQISISVSRAVQSMQFEDMCRQLLEHVGKRVKTLQEVADYTDTIGHSIKSVQQNPASYAATLAKLNEQLKGLEPKMKSVAHKSVEQEHLDSGDIELF